MVMVIVAGAIIFGKFLAVTRVPSNLAAWLSGLPLPGWCIIGLMIVFYLVGGCFLDALALDILTIPIFYPVDFGSGLRHHLVRRDDCGGDQMGVITPPVGVCVYVVSGMARDVPLEKVFRGSMPFLWALVLAAVLLMHLPADRHLPAHTRSNN